jgi:hypothetical protein
LRPDVAHEVLWRYLDSVVSSTNTRYPTSFKSVKEFEAYRNAAIPQLRRSLGLDPWPERTPLNARVVGTVERDDFRIEKIVFESQPGFVVDALLYIPKKATLPVPGILGPIGHHGENDFFIWSEQTRCIGLARKGYVVLTYDPSAQGERTWLRAGNNLVSAHDTIRRQVILGGLEASGLMIWDSIRAIDYLCSRTEVDAP